MKDIKDQRKNLGRRKEFLFGKLRDFFKLKKSADSSEEEKIPHRKEAKVKWEDKVDQKKLERFIQNKVY